MGLSSGAKNKSPKAPPVKLSRELTDMALILMKLIKHEFRHELRHDPKSRHRVKPPTLTQFKMLYMIQSGTRQVGKLSEAFGISQPATSKMIDAMAKDGLLKRTPHPKDRRQIELHLTSQGSSIIEAMFKRAFAKIDHQLDSFSNDKKKGLARQVREISDLLVTPQKLSVLK